MRCWAIVFSLGLLSVCIPSQLAGQGPTISIETPLSPPGWALLERQLIETNTLASSSESQFSKDPQVLP